MHKHYMEIYWTFFSFPIDLNYMVLITDIVVFPVPYQNKIKTLRIWLIQNNIMLIIHNNIIIIISAMMPLLSGPH